MTVGAHGYFARFGFASESIERVPQSLKASVELQGACPSTATLMALELVAASD